MQFKEGLELIFLEISYMVTYTNWNIGSKKIHSYKRTNYVWCFAGNITADNITGGI